MTDTLGNTMSNDAYYAKDVGEVLLIDSRMGRFELIEYFLQTDVEYEGAIKNPVRFSLKQNYPNPFNPTTTIAYSLPKDSQVTLSIYNVSGQIGHVLKDEHQPAGNYTATWDANGVPSGLYFCTLKSGDFVQTKEMLFLK